MTWRSRPQPRKSTGPVDQADADHPPSAVRHRLHQERASITHKFSIAGHEGYITVGMYPGGEPGEIFITMAKEGSTVSGLMDSFALAISIALQHGVPLKLLCDKFAHTRFEPSGWTNNSDIGYAKSIMDYIFRWLQLRFVEGRQGELFEGLRPKPIAAIQAVEEAPAVAPTTTVDKRPAAGGKYHACRRAERVGGHGRCAQLPRLRRHHDAQRQLLPLHELRINFGMQLNELCGRNIEFRTGGEKSSAQAELFLLQLLVWDGHSCPQPLTLLFLLSCRAQRDSPIATTELRVAHSSLLLA